MTGTHDDPRARPPSPPRAPHESKTPTEYPDEMKELLASKPGLPPRFSPNPTGDVMPPPPELEPKHGRDRGIE